MNTKMFLVSLSALLLFGATTRADVETGLKIIQTADDKTIIEVLGECDRTKVEVVEGKEGTSLRVSVRATPAGPSASLSTETSTTIRSLVVKNAVMLVDAYAQIGFTDTYGNYYLLFSGPRPGPAANTHKTGSITWNRGGSLFFHEMVMIQGKEYVRVWKRVSQEEYNIAFQ